MVNVIRRSQIIGLMSLDTSTASRFATVEEVWTDNHGRVVCFSSGSGYIPLEQVATIGIDALLTYSDLLLEAVASSSPLYRRLVRLPSGESIGWIDDFLFDWETGEIVAYILAGKIAEPWGGKAVLYPEDIATIEAEAVVIKEEAPQKLKGEGELQQFLSEKSQQVRRVVGQMVNKLRSLISAQDSPEVVRVKIRQVRDDLAQGTTDHNLLEEAASFLQEKWQALQQSITRTASRMENALQQAWQKLTGKP
ncbi:MAG: photosystem reaction center subunit H [Pseudanabaenaceae cyanobacterium SKYGB_i_bin29]|nr:photosystem reaction center subunit H [Pseudanabaenaceae cyanobacterium SKYG29]MDW8421733.1 photosystem reaction center subunit H [Pseudanabaenaceae cyanobacterium SKYGB_i_bin29]